MARHFSEWQRTLEARSFREACDQACRGDTHTGGRNESPWVQDLAVEGEAALAHEGAAKLGRGAAEAAGGQPGAEAGLVEQADRGGREEQGVVHGHREAGLFVRAYPGDARVGNVR